MGRPSSVLVLAEDQRQQRFVRRYLERLNFPLHEIRNEPLPSGLGAGEQWVRERYAKAVRAYRARAARAQTALMVAIDADAQQVAYRVRQLKTILEQENLDERGENERIVHLIPKRNIETWILCLTGTGVDEETNYHHHPDIDGRIKPAAEAFYDWSRPNAVTPDHCVPSLSAAIPEVRKIEY